MLLPSEEFRDKLEMSLEASNERVIVLSAFVKLHALKWLFAHSSTNDILVVARWQLHDLICGASDLQCYEFCRDKGIPFGILLDLHGKVYCVDNYIFVGSANLTSRGMGLSNQFNSEMGIGFIGGIADKVKIDGLLGQVTWLNDDLVNAMQKELARPRENSISETSAWPKLILDQISTPSTRLWVHELPFCSPEDILETSEMTDNSRHDLAMIGVDQSDLELERLLIAFQKTKAFFWLNKFISTETSVSFGKVTAELHNIILDDPTPYRMEIKTLVKNLLDWAAFYPEHFFISQPRYSTVISSVRPKPIVETAKK